MTFKIYESTFLLLLTVFCLFSKSASAIEDYCSVNQFITHGNYMQFTKEPSRNEFAVAGKFKGLHCCSKGYRSIEWYRDGKAYPWHDTSTPAPMIIYPESSNQTVYTQTVMPDDAGNYTCVLRNESVIHVHTINLIVYDKVPDDPKITYISRDTPASLGQPVRLFCEAFVGRVDLPDAFNEAEWIRSDRNSTRDGINQFTVTREEGQTLGTYLIIDSLIADDYGKYTCIISKPGKTIELSVDIHKADKPEVYINPNPFPTKDVVLCGIVLIIVSLTLITIYLRYGLSLRVYLKDHFGNPNDKQTDVLVVYSPQDSDIVLGVLLPTLQNTYRYSCGAKELPPNVELWSVSLRGAAMSAARLVAYVSPSALNEKWNCDSLYAALKQLQHADPGFCCVLPRELPRSDNQTKNSLGETLASLADRTVVWERSNDRKFWLSLRAKLPPVPRCRQGRQTLDEIRVVAAAPMADKSLQRL